jgi:hypothetical protein
MLCGGIMANTSRAEWAKRVEQWRDSGLSVKQFAAETGLKASTLTYWKWKLRTAASDPGSTTSGEHHTVNHDIRALKSVAPKFVEMESVRTAAPAPMELVIDGRLTLRVPIGFDDETLSRVLRVCGALR